VNPKDIAKPDSAKQLTKEKIENLIEELSVKIEGLSAKFKELSGFVKKRSVFGAELNYENNIKYRENPEYAELKAKNDKDLTLNEKRRLAYMRKEVPVFPEEDSFKLHIQFTNQKDLYESSRSILPAIWICDWAVELSARGKNEKRTDQISAAILAILKDFKKGHES
jgi:hypothetical protein